MQTTDSPIATIDSTQTPVPPSAGGDASRRGSITLLAVCTAILVLIALYYGEVILAPVVFALFIIALVWPLQSGLQARIPRLAAMAVTVVVVVVVLAVLGTLIGWGFGRAARWLLADSARFQALYLQGVEWLEGHGFAVAGVFSDVFSVSWMVRTVQSIGARLQSIVSFSVVVAVFLILGLLEVEETAAKLRAMRNRAAGEAVVAAAAKTAAKLQKYMLVRTAMSVMTGALVWAFSSLIGLPLAAEWGVIAFALNYIPFIGSFIATLAPTLFALVHFESWQVALGVFAGLNIIQFVVGSYLEPRVAGSALSISPFIVLLAVFLWSFLWGIAGAFIGVPIVIALITVCEQYPASQWVAGLLAGSKSEG
ncbi:AI-2E family transporter [Blastochloris tepida]|uniref:AI-2E family transporter n=1 Tax=Blastochloris tepida TaxID=2233851 RepID=A0A348G2Y9_9HYPH|nr:AI-2E family transporter [Blastochloris tepida]BBF93922.1 AI-2E family transporter [Blastochloris tepida]